MNKVELLVPVGNKETLYAAIHNGADAVYLGGKKFGARAYANNFTEEELKEAIKLCHLYNVKIYVTVNTMIYNHEVEEIIAYLNFLYENNVDAVIMQDLGIINLTRKLIPNLSIHISTQAHNQNQEQINYYYNIGCQRVVFDRELSLEEINSIKSPIEKEIFVYSALCISYSGNCLFSALNGTRSANRGMCVGSCRLPYKLYLNKEFKKEGYLLSTKDLNTIENLKEILDSNITSLKIEGRMKSKEYVALVTKIYRRLIDNYYQKKSLILTTKEKEDLLKTYNREFTKGYLFKENNILNEKTSNHQGIKIGKVIDLNKNKIVIKLTSKIHQQDAIRLAKINKGMYLNTIYNQKGLLIKEANKNDIIYLNNKDHLNKKDIIGSDVLKTIDYLLNQELNNPNNKKLPINLNFIGKINEPSTLILSYQNKKIVINGPSIQIAKTSPITKERIVKQLSKLGDTPFIINNIEVNIPSNIFINIKDLNNIRRKAIEELLITINSSTKENKYVLPLATNTLSNKSYLSILVRNEEQLKIALKNNIDYLYTPNYNLYLKYKDKTNIYYRLNRISPKLTNYHNENLLCTELGSIIKYKEDNHICSDYYLNIANDYAIQTLKKLNVDRITLSIECNLKDLENIKNKKDIEIIIYGTIECMIIKNNIFNIKHEQAYIEDLKNNKYPVTYEDNCTHIYNHEPLNNINYLPKLKGFNTYRIELLNEGAKEVQNIINKVKDMI